MVLDLLIAVLSCGTFSVVMAFSFTTQRPPNENPRSGDPFPCLFVYCCRPSADVRHLYCDENSTEFLMPDRFASCC